MNLTHSPRRSLSRTNRRVLVLTAYLGFLALILAWTLIDQPWRWLLVLPLGFATLRAFGLLLLPKTLGTSDGTDDDLDERQLQVRNHGYLNAYRVLGFLVTLSALYYFIAGDTGWWLPTTENERTAFFWGTWGLTMALPASILAWTEPDFSGH